MFNKHSIDFAKAFFLYFFSSFTTLLLFQICISRDLLSYIPESNLSLEVISIDEDFFTFESKEHLSKDDVDYIITKLELSTKWQENTIRFKPGSGRLISWNEHNLTVQFYMPVTTTYHCDLYTFGHLYKCDINVTNFTHDNDYSRFRCHHESSFPERWCEGHNIPMFDGILYFFSPSAFTFPSPFLIPGPRCAPFDKKTDRLDTEPIVLTKKIGDASIGDVDNNFNYLYGGFYNYHQLWHTIFDFILPFYRFVNMFNFGDDRKSRRIYAKSDPIFSFNELFEFISEKNPAVIKFNTRKNVLFRNIVIGIERNERFPFMNRTTDDSISFNYDFNESFAPDFRDKFLDHVKVNKSLVGEKGKVLISFIDRRGKGRSLNNTDEIVARMYATCPFCDIRLAKFENLRFIDQISLVSRSSVLAGIHGSGLSNVIFMASSSPNHSTHLIEFLPYKYTCRNWYHTAAKVARVNYHAASSSIPEYNTLESCYSNDKLCATALCHDKLRDQSTIIDIEEFDKIWLPIVEQLNNTIVNDL